MPKHLDLLAAASIIALCVPAAASAQDVTISDGQTVTDAVELDGDDTLRVARAGSSPWMTTRWSFVRPRPAC